MTALALHPDRLFVGGTVSRLRCHHRRLRWPRITTRIAAEAVMTAIGMTVAVVIMGFGLYAG